MIKVYAYLDPNTLTSQADIIHARGNINEKILDEYVLPFFQERLEKENGKSLFIVQLMGAHYMFNQRYPENFAKWKPDQADNFLEKNNAYDNAVLYDDFVVSEIMKMAEKEKAIIFFTSDHGESLGENGRWYHGSKTRVEAKEQFEVPFFIYLTEKFASTSKGKEVLKALKRNSKRQELSHDNIFHTVLGCAGVKNKNPSKPLIEDDLNLCYNRK
jgi:KDO II ethanolaminephosphotransferase